MIRKIVNDELGISLLEVLISMLVLSIGVLGLAPMLVLSVESNVLSRDNTVSSKLMKEKIEYFESLDPMPAMPYYQREAGLNQLFTRTTTINDITTDTLIPDGLFKIDVNIAWVDHEQLQQSRTYSTYISKR
jgi:Tfp pilus assembly protein PilV